jgi:hypothetical protein
MDALRILNLLEWIPAFAGMTGEALRRGACTSHIYQESGRQAAARMGHFEHVGAAADLFAAKPQHVGVTHTNPERTSIKSSKGLALLQFIMQKA